MTKLKVVELREIAKDLKIKNYNTLARSELVREIRMKTKKQITRQEIVDCLKDARQLVCDMAEQRREGGQGHSSYRAISETIRHLIMKVEKFND